MNSCDRRHRLRFLFWSNGKTWHTVLLEKKISSLTVTVYQFHSFSGVMDHFSSRIISCVKRKKKLTFLYRRKPDQFEQAIGSTTTDAGHWATVSIMRPKNEKICVYGNTGRCITIKICTTWWFAQHGVIADFVKVEMALPEEHDRCSYKRAKRFVKFSIAVNVAFGRSFRLRA